MLERDLRDHVVKKKDLKSTEGEDSQECLSSYIWVAWPGMKQPLCQFSL